MKIAIIGTGNLGLSIAQGLIINNTITSLYLTKRNIESIEEWNENKYVTVTKNNIEAVKKSDILIFSVQPNQFEEILNEINTHLTNKHIIISTITGFHINRIESVIGNKIPIIRSMPNTAISVGKSMTCLCSNEIGEKRIDIASAIFNGLGNSIIINENDMQAATVLCASGIAFWMRIIRAMTQGGIQLGFEASEAMKMSTFTALGASSLLLENNSHPEKEIDKVTTPNGCTIKGLNEMEHKGLSSSIIQGLVASFEKINEMSKK